MCEKCLIYCDRDYLQAGNFIFSGRAARGSRVLVGRGRARLFIFPYSKLEFTPEMERRKSIDGSNLPFSFPKLNFSPPIYLPEPKRRFKYVYRKGGGGASGYHVKGQTYGLPKSNL